MPEIRLVKKYPHIKDEDVTSIFQEGYIKGFENGRKGAIPIEWIKNYARHKASKGFTEIDRYWQYWEEDVLKMVADWEEEQASLFEKQITEECTSAERFAEWEKENE